MRLFVEKTEDKDEKNRGFYRGIGANSAGSLATRIGHIVVSLWIKRIAQMEIYQARLHNGAQISIINLENAVHTGKYDYDTAVDGNSPSTQACTCASRHNRHIVTRCYFYNLGNF